LSSEVGQLRLERQAKASNKNWPQIRLLRFPMPQGTCRGGNQEHFNKS
jgi:hypothetical protein